MGFIFLGKNQKLTDQQLVDLANYDPGGCLCGHFESCSVCSRSDKTREFEKTAQLAALELLRERGVALEFRREGYTDKYVIKAI